MCFCGVNMLENKKRKIPILKSCLKATSEHCCHVATNATILCSCRCRCCYRCWRDKRKSEASANLLKNLVAFLSLVLNICECLFRFWQRSTALKNYDRCSFVFKQKTEKATLPKKFTAKHKSPTSNNCLTILLLHRKSPSRLLHTLNKSQLELIWAPHVNLTAETCIYYRNYDSYYTRVVYDYWVGLFWVHFLFNSRHL